MKSDYEPNSKRLKFKSGDLYLHIDRFNKFRFYYKDEKKGLVRVRDLIGDKSSDDKLRLLKDRRLYKLTKTYIDYVQYGFNKYPMTFVNPDISRMLSKEAREKLKSFVTLRYFGVVSSYKTVKLDSVIALEDELSRLNEVKYQAKQPTAKKETSMPKTSIVEERVK